MRVVVSGAGSIGKRHLRNLKKIGVERVAVCDPDPNNREAIAKELGLAEAYADLSRAALEPGDVVYVATPNHLHVPQALVAAESGCHIFVEKPLSHNRDHLDRLCDTVRRKNLVSLVGCNMRFYPAISMLKRFVEEGRIGRILSYRAGVGIYLPNWRPHLDYRKNYGAQRAQGGGVILDCIHELDYIRWIVGHPDRVQAAYAKVSDLEIDTEDLAEITLIHDRMIGSVHLDYLSHRYTRTVHLIGERGDLYWEWHRKGVEHADGPSKKTEFYPMPENYDLNQMYLDETNYFLECVRSKKQTFFPFDEARRVLEIALTAKESQDAEAGRVPA